MDVESERRGMGLWRVSRGLRRLRRDARGELGDRLGELI
jgi:hypothetical protein